MLYVVCYIYFMLRDLIMCTTLGLDLVFVYFMINQVLQYIGTMYKCDLHIWYHVVQKDIVTVWLKVISPIWTSLATNYSDGTLETSTLHQDEFQNALPPQISSLLLCTHFDVLQLSYLLLLGIVIKSGSAAFKVNNITLWQSHLLF